MHAFARRLAAGVVFGAALCGLFAAPAHAAAPSRAAGVPHLNYYGGRVLSNVKVDVVVWGSWSYGTTVPLNGGRSITSFFRGITASRYVDWLNEYDTRAQHIGRGTLEGVYVVRPPSSANAAWVTSTQIDGALHSLISAGRLPQPNSNRLYVLFFRSGQVRHIGRVCRIWSD